MKLQAVIIKRVIDACGGFQKMKLQMFRTPIDRRKKQGGCRNEYQREEQHRFPKGVYFDLAFISFLFILIKMPRSRIVFHLLFSIRLLSGKPCVLCVLRRLAPMTHCMQPAMLILFNKLSLLLLSIKECCSYKTEMYLLPNKTKYCWPHTYQLERGCFCGLW